MSSRDHVSADIDRILSRLGQTPAHGRAAPAFGALLAEYRDAVQRRRASAAAGAGTQASGESGETAVHRAAPVQLGR